MLEEIFKNQYINWAFSGVGVALISIGFYAIKRLFNIEDKQDKTNMNTSNNSNIYNIISSGGDSSHQITKGEKDLELTDLMQRINILFIDDKKFDVVDILKSYGWLNTIWIKDVNNINEPQVKNANIIFVDIQGVGVKLRFSEEGLGLARVLKEKHPDKKIVIYSAEQSGDRFHETLKIVDDFLSKDSDPYQFEEVVSRLAKEIK